MSDETTADVLLVVSRLVWYAGIVGVIGASAFRLFAPPVSRDANRAAATIGLSAASLLAAATLARLYAQTFVSFGPDEPVTFELLLIVAAELPPWSTGWLMQAGAAGIAVVAFTAARAGKGAGWIAAHAAGLAVAGTAPLTGHAVAQPGGSVVPVALQAIHVLGAGVWIGGLFVMLVVAVARHPPLEPTSLAAAVQAFSPVALGAAGVLIATGTVTTALYLHAASDLWTSGYGRTLLGKVAIVGGVVLAGYRNWQHVRPRLPDPGGADVLRRTAIVELLFALAVLGLTAVLVGLPQPGE